MFVMRICISDIPICIFDVPICLFDIPLCIFNIPMCLFDITSCIFDINNMDNLVTNFFVQNIFDAHFILFFAYCVFIIEG